MVDEPTDSSDSSEETSGSVWPYVIAAVSAVVGLLALHIGVFIVALAAGPDSPSLFCTPGPHLPRYYYLIQLVGAWAAIFWVYTAEESTVHAIDAGLMSIEGAVVVLVGLYGAVQYPLEWHMCADLFGTEKAYAAYRPLVQHGAHLCASCLGVAAFVQYRLHEGCTWRIALRFAPATLFILVLVAISLWGATPMSAPPVGDPGLMPIPSLAPTH